MVWSTNENCLNIAFLATHSAWDKMKKVFLVKLDENYAFHINLSIKYKKDISRGSKARQDLVKLGILKGRIER